VTADSYQHYSASSVRFGGGEICSHFPQPTQPCTQSPTFSAIMYIENKRTTEVSPASMQPTIADNKVVTTEMGVPTVNSEKSIADAATEEEEVDLTADAEDVFVDAKQDVVPNDATPTTPTATAESTAEVGVKVVQKDLKEEEVPSDEEAADATEAAAATDVVRCCCSCCCVGADGSPCPRQHLFGCDISLAISHTVSFVNRRQRLPKIPPRTTILLRLLKRPSLPMRPRWNRTRSAPHPTRTSTSKPPKQSAPLLSSLSRTKTTRSSSCWKQPTTNHYTAHLQDTSFSFVSSISARLSVILHWVACLRLWSRNPAEFIDFLL
jgi:hypothetical protein